VLLLALITFGVTAWFLGLRNGGIAGGISVAAVLAAEVIPKTAIAVYALHVLWIGGLAYFGPKWLKARRPKAQASWRGDASRLVRRGLALWRNR